MSSHVAIFIAWSKTISLACVGNQLQFKYGVWSFSTQNTGTDFPWHEYKSGFPSDTTKTITLEVVNNIAAWEIYQIYQIELILARLRSIWLDGTLYFKGHIIVCLDTFSLIGHLVQHHFVTVDRGNLFWLVLSKDDIEERQELFVPVAFMMLSNGTLKQALAVYWDSQASAILLLPGLVGFLTFPHHSKACCCTWLLCNVGCGCNIFACQMKTDINWSNFDGVEQ